MIIGRNELVKLLCEAEDNLSFVFVRLLFFVEMQMLMHKLAVNVHMFVD